MNERYSTLNRKIKELVKKDVESTKLIKNLDERNNYLLEEINNLRGIDQYRIDKIRQLEVERIKDKNRIRDYERREKVLKARINTYIMALVLTYLMIVLYNIA